MPYTNKIKAPTGTASATRRVKPVTVPFDIVAEAYDEVLSGTVAGQTTDQDTVYDTITGAVVNHNMKVQVSTFCNFYVAPNGGGLGNVQVDQNGNARPINPGPGSGQINARSLSGQKSVFVNVNQESGQSSQAFNSFVAGSAAKHCWDAIQNRIASLTASRATTMVFFEVDLVNFVWTRDPNCWLTGVDLSPLPPWNSTGKQKKGGCLVTPRDVICAKHYPFSVGETLRFVGMDNVTCTRTVTHTWTNPNGGDLMACHLDAAVDANIKFAKVLPTNWQTYFPNIIVAASGGVYNLSTVPMWFTNQDGYEGIHVQNWQYMSPKQPAQNYTDLLAVKPVNAKQQEFYYLGYSGDSGSPMGLIINNELVLMCCLLGINGGPSLCTEPEQSLLNAQFAAWPGGYQLTPADLSSFTTW